MAVRPESESETSRVFFFVMADTGGAAEGKAKKNKAHHKNKKFGKGSASDAAMRIKGGKIGKTSKFGARGSGGEGNAKKKSKQEAMAIRELQVRHGSMVYPRCAS